MLVMTRPLARWTSPLASGVWAALLFGGAFICSTSPQASSADEPLASQPLVVEGEQGADEAAGMPAEEASIADRGTREEGGESMDGSAVTDSVPKRRGNAGRLPPFFSGIVDSQQRQAIYEIRSRRATQLDALQQQIDAMRKAEMAEMEAILTEAQRAKLAVLRAERATTLSMARTKASVGQRTRLNDATSSEETTVPAVENAGELKTR